MKKSYVTPEVEIVEVEVEVGFEGSGTSNPDMGDGGDI